jgi:catechol 2,3-dioxygenase-like lactoylglutathione lyase family enzyme
MNEEAGLDQVLLAAPPGCEEAARRFYGQILGMREVPKPAELAKRGGCCFVYGPQQIQIGFEPAFRPALMAHPAIRLSDRRAYDALLARLAEAGVVVKHDTERKGALRFFTGDPWGNRLEVMLPLAA